MHILAIETSCDETSLALVHASGGLSNPKFEIQKNLVASQINVHRPFGGVVPILAKREHLKNLPHIWKQLKKYESHIDAIAVTVGPGLGPALWTGVEFARTLAEELNKPLIGTNHLEGHLYAFLSGRKEPLSKILPAIALIVSGGHTIVLKVDSLSKWKKLGETRDDAAGESFDKVAKMMKLPYPGGPEIEKLAKEGNPKAIQFPRPMLNLGARGPDRKRRGNYEFSFSGLKTSVLYYLRDQKEMKKRVNKKNVAASFQAAVFEVLIKKTLRAAKENKSKSILLSGGVASSKSLVTALRREAKKENLQLHVAVKKLNTDNAAMIGIAAYMTYLRKKKYKITAQPNLNL